MSDDIEQSEDADQSAGVSSQVKGVGVKVSKAKLAKVLPTERVSFEKQLSVLRAWPAASGAGKKPVSNDEVAAVLSGLAADSISLCNPFFTDNGLLVREGRKLRPADVLFDYLHAYEWKPDTAALKLKDVFAQSWAAETLLPKLSFRQLTRDEAIQFLADESKAQKSHRKNLEVLLEFLNATGVVRVEGNTVMKGAANGVSPPPPPPGPDNQGDDRGDFMARAEAEARKRMEEEAAAKADVERFTIPIPGKEAAVITVPRNLDADDWDMLSLMIGTYIKRLRNESLKGSGAS